MRTAFLVAIVALVVFSCVAEARYQGETFNARHLLLNCENKTSIIDTVGCGAKTAANATANAVTSAANVTGNAVTGALNSAGEALGIKSAANTASYTFAAVIAAGALLFQ